MNIENKLAHALRAAMDCGEAFKAGKPAGWNHAAWEDARDALAEYDEHRKADVWERRALVVSTAHTERGELELIGNAWPHRVIGYDEGAMLFLGDPAEDSGNDDGLSISDGVRGAVLFARAHGYDWLHFDADADALEGVQTYEW